MAIPTENIAAKTIPAVVEGAMGVGGAIETRGGIRSLFNRELLAYLGPGFLVTVGFIDPGNWATNMAGGAQFENQLLWVITLSTLMLIVLQHMVARLGVVTGRSLAQNCRELFPPYISAVLGVTIFVASVATSVAEYLGAAIGLNILFGIPVPLGALLTLLVVTLVILGNQYQRLERIIMGLLALVALAYVIELFTVDPDLGNAIPHFFLPKLDSDSILVAMGMLGAVVMPHNLYLHSGVIQSRSWGQNERERRRLLRFALVDTSLAMGVGWLVNSAMIIVASEVFFRAGVSVHSLEQAADTLKPLAGEMAGLVFGIALLLAGVGSSITVSLASANVVTGYLKKPAGNRSPWFVAGFLAASLPAIGIIALGLDSYRLLIMSQVVLSLQLPFTVLPLLYLARSRKVMGHHASRGIELGLAVATAVVVLGLNLLLLIWAGGLGF